MTAPLEPVEPAKVSGAVGVPGETNPATSEAVVETDSTGVIVVGGAGLVTVNCATSEAVVETDSTGVIVVVGSGLKLIP